jgi:hypothetical protein
MVADLRKVHLFHIILKDVNNKVATVRSQYLDFPLSEFYKQWTSRARRVKSYIEVDHKRMSGMANLYFVEVQDCLFSDFECRT